MNQSYTSISLGNAKTQTRKMLSTSTQVAKPKPVFTVNLARVKRIHGPGFECSDKKIYLGGPGFYQK